MIISALVAAGITAAVSIGTSIYNNYQNEKASKEAKAAAEKASAELKQSIKDYQTETSGMINSHYGRDNNGARSPEEQARIDAIYAGLDEALANSNQEEFIKNFYDENGLGDKFSYDKAIKDFMDPRADYLRELAARTAQGSAAGGGMGRSYDGAMAMGNAVVAKDEELYKNALSEYNTDRTQNYNEWNSFLQQKQNELTQLLSGQQNDLSNLKDLAQIYRDEDSNYWSDLMNLRNAAFTTGTNAGVAMDTAAMNTGNYQSTLANDMIGAVGAGAQVGTMVNKAMA